MKNLFRFRLRSILLLTNLVILALPLGGIIWLRLYESALIRQTVWSRAIAGAFETSRGMALATMLTGMALTSALAPSIGNALIAGLGWRAAYVALGLGWGGLAFALLVLFFHGWSKLRPQPS